MNTVNLKIDAPLFHKKLPNWKQLSLEGAYRVRKLFEEKDVAVILSANETFLRKLLKRFGSKVGVALFVNEKNGCSIMITLDILASIVLPPFIIFTGFLVLY